MRIYFRSEVRAQITEHWSIEAPPNWPQMSNAQRLAWLEENIESAKYLSQDKVRDEGNWAVLDFHGS
ncbi:MAG TPA: hypothetical protein VFZ29_04230 [Solirubrobacterales bacterium]